MSNSEKIYKQLQTNGKTSYLLRSLGYFLEYDQESQMPSAGLAFRAEQNKFIAELQHKQTTSKKIERLLEKVCDLKTGKITASELSPRQQASVREMRRDYLSSTKITTSFIKKFSDATSNGVDAWKKARTENSFRTFAPFLKKIVDLSKKKAEMLGYKHHPYDALLNEFEPGMTVAELDKLFSSLKDHLKIIVNKRKESKEAQQQPTNPFFSIPHQKELSKKIIAQMGLPIENYHLAETAHPFCIPLCSKDIRITTNYHQNDFKKAYFATIHECGHALYENGLPESDIGTPLAEAASFGIHESQSRFWECFIGHSYPFWKNQYPLVRDAFPNTFDNTTLDQFVRSINTVSPSLIRIFADEVTYNLHIILRYELEKGLIDGSIQVKDIPKLWNAKMKDMLGVTPKTDAEGCLQDIHWSIGAFGYFPSYALGNLYAGALYVHMIKTHSSWDQKVAQGDFSFIKEYLRKNIHQYGREFSPVELIEKAIGGKFSSAPYLSYLDGKYL